MKAQAAAEYLVIIAIALTILVPLILYSSQSLISYKEDVKVTTARNVVNKLAESANWVYSQGPPARLTVNVCIPEGVQEIMEEIYKTREIRNYLKEMMKKAGVDEEIIERCIK